MEFVSCNGWIWSHNFSEGTAKEAKRLDSLCIKIRNQAIKAKEGMKLHGGFYAVLSSSKKLQEDKLLPVALMTSIACDLHWISLHFLATLLSRRKACIGEAYSWRLLWKASITFIMHKCEKTQSCLIVRLELKEKSGGINWAFGFGVAEKVLCRKHWLAWLWVQKPQPAAAVEAVLPPSYLGSQRGDQMYAREEEMHSDRYWSRKGKFLDQKQQKKQWLSHCLIEASSSAVVSPLYIT